jgi:hypothetical protein
MFGGNGDNNGDGGGGAGLGGALFQQAGTLYLINDTFTNNTATGGASGGGSATRGQGKGGAIFINPGATATSLGGGPTFSGNSAQDAGGTFANPQDNNDVVSTLAIDAGATLSATAGTPQGADVNTNFGAPLQATLQDGGGNPIANAVLPFSAPPSGASATLSPLGGPTDADGQVRVTATTNGTGGSYTVTAGGGALSASFSLSGAAPAAPAPPPAPPAPGPASAPAATSSDTFIPLAVDVYFLDLASTLSSADTGSLLDGWMTSQVAAITALLPVTTNASLAVWLGDLAAFVSLL